MQRITVIHLLAAAAATAGAQSRAPRTQHEAPLATFTIQEHFGVAHPDQIIDFDCDERADPENSYMIGPQGEVVPCQFMEGGRKIAVRASLAAGGKKTWKLMSGPPPADATGAVKVMEGDGHYDITNGLVGVRVPSLPPGGGSTGKPLAPIQGLKLQNGTWTATGPNYLTIAGNIKTMTVDVVERGPLRVTVEVRYKLDRGQLKYGQQVIAQAGPGEYISRIQVFAGQPSVLIEEDSDTQFNYNLAFKGIKLNQARYRGHHSRDKRHGYEEDGRQYRASHERVGCDAFFDLPFDRHYRSDYHTNLDTWPSIRRMVVWDPWAYDSGWYWQLYDKDGGAETPVIGIFAGRASRARDIGNSGTGIYTDPGNGTPCVGLTISTNHRGPSGRIYAKMRYQWGFFAGRKGSDLTDADKVQPINRQMNIHGGINLNKIHRLQFDFPDPPTGYGSMYMDGKAVRKMIQRLKTDKTYHRYCYNTVPYTRPLIDMWCDTTGEKLKGMVGQIRQSVQSFLDALVNGGGIYNTHVHYWHGGLTASRHLLWIDQILASEFSSVEDRATVTRAAVLFASILFDEDFVPLSNQAGVNLGTPNMPVQQSNFRNMYALFLARYPMMKDRTGAVWNEVRSMIRETINEHGCHMGCTHYIGAANGPLLSTLQQLQMAGVADPFRSERRLAKYAEFEMHFSTPPDPRYGNVRKRPAVGDSCPDEATEFLGQLGTAFARINPELSARVFGAWRQSGKPQSDFHGATILKIDETLPGRDPELGSAHFQGWYSVLRLGWGTPNESTAFFVNGGYYRDHASNDLGEVIIYALSAPLSLDFGSMYSPHSPGGFVHSVVLPEDRIGSDWKLNPPDHTKGPRWHAPEIVSFQANGKGSHSRASFQLGETSWIRAISMTRLRKDLPVIAIQDTFNNDASKVFLLNLMAQGDVETPQGKKKIGQAFYVRKGVSRLGFTGQTFPLHHSQGIDWDLFVMADKSTEGFLAHWSHKNHGGECQHILRLKSRGAFRVFIVPYAKGKRPADIRVNQVKHEVVITAAGKTAHVRPDGSFRLR